MASSLTHSEHIPDRGTQRMIDRAVFEQRVLLDERRDCGVVRRKG